MESNSLFDRIMRAAFLDPSLYREVADGHYPPKEGYLVVAIVAFCTAMGSTVKGLLMGSPATAVFSALAYGLTIPLLYIVLVSVSYFVAKNALRGEGPASAVRCTIAYAMVPQMLRLFIFIPTVGTMLAAVGFVWSIVASIIALSVAMEFEPGKAVVSGGAGWAIALVTLTIILP